MADMRNWSHEFIEKFIERYRELPCLYNIKSKDYTNKPMKIAAYAQLVDMLKTVDPTATKDLVVKKINNMRSSYRKELKKLKSSKRTGSSGETYEPSLWYFHHLDFLYDHEVPRKSQSNANLSPTDSEEEAHEDTENDNASRQEDGSEPEISQDQESMQSPISSVTTPSLSSAATSIRRKRSKVAKRQATEALNNQEKVLQLVADKLQSPNKYSNYGVYVGQELDALPPMMATYCQKIINDAIFEAKCGSLNGQSRIVSQPLINITNSQQSNAMYTTSGPLLQRHGEIASTSVLTASEYHQPPSWQDQSQTASSFYGAFNPHNT